MAQRKNLERWWWKHLYEQGERSARKRQEYERWFKSLFPDGHRESIRDFVRTSKEASEEGFFDDKPALKYLTNIHPDAFEIIAEFGIDYSPKIFRKPAPFGEPETAGCYQNALRLMALHRNYLKRHPRVKDRRELVYVEGVAWGSMVLPMLHGWNARSLQSRTALDWTLYATCKWTRYLGIPFTSEEHHELAKLTTRTNIFSKQYFNEKAKERCLEILKARNHELKKAA